MSYTVNNEKSLIHFKLECFTQLRREKISANVPLKKIRQK